MRVDVPGSVLDAFGLSVTPVPLASGQGTSWRAGDVVLKSTENPEEAAWTANLLASLSGPGFRVQKPRATPGGQWVVDGWAARHWLEGEPAGPNGGRWPETFAACHAFHVALGAVPRPAFLNKRTDAWSEADRLAWGEAPAVVSTPFTGLVDRLFRVRKPLHLPSQVVHGDLTGNVLFAPGEPPGVIDLAPYWRPAGFAVAVVVTDALAWGGADRSILRFARGVTEFPQLFGRATLRRVLELDQRARRGQPGMDEQVAAWEGSVRIAEELASG